MKFDIQKMNLATTTTTTTKKKKRRRSKKQDTKPITNCSKKCPQNSSSLLVVL